MKPRPYEIAFRIPTSSNTPNQKAVVHATDKAAARRVFEASYPGARISGTITELRQTSCLRY